MTINHLYEINKNKLDKANKQLVGKIEDEHSLFYHGADQTKMKKAYRKLKFIYQKILQLKCIP